MASPDSSTHQRGQKRSYNNELYPTNAHRPALDVAPLSAVPFSGSPPKSPANYTCASTEREAQTELNETGMVLLSQQQTREELENVLAASSTVRVQLTGTAANGKAGPIVGLVDIGESEDSYMFRVSLPGVLTHPDDFSCYIKPSGEITIEGVTATGEKIVHKKYHTFEMLSGNLCPPGHFSISFQLPGPVDEYQFQGRFGIDGIAEGIVKKI